LAAAGLRINFRDGAQGGSAKDLALLDVDDYRIRSLPVGQKNQFDVSASRQAAGDFNVDLIQSGKTILRASKQHRRVQAANRG
jgi:hypothetical protein